MTNVNIAERESDDAKPVDNSRDALALMSKAFYERYGDDALPIIGDIWYRLGASAGRQLRAQLPSGDFRTVATAWVERAKRHGIKMGTAKSKWEVSETLYRVTSSPGYQCSLGLNNAGRKLCEAVMLVDKAEFESATGREVDLRIDKSVAAGDVCCDVSISVEEAI